MNTIKHISILLLLLFGGTAMAGITGLGGTAMAMAGTPESEPGVKVDTIRYAAPGGYPLHMYLIRPAEISGKLPVIIYVPGSAWKKQRMEGCLKAMAPMTRRQGVLDRGDVRPLRRLPQILPPIVLLMVHEMDP